MSFLELQETENLVRALAFIMVLESGPMKLCKGLWYVSLDEGGEINAL